MTPHVIERLLKIEMAVLKFDIGEIIEENITNRPVQKVAGTGRTVQGESLIMSPTRPIIGTRKHCKNCRLERIELIDKKGITDSGFKTWKWAQTCDRCKRNDCLEYLPIRLGDNVLDTVNEILSECRPKKNEPLPEIQRMESMKEWRTALKMEYKHMQKTIDRTLPPLSLPIQYIISIKSLMTIQDVTHPGQA